MHCRHGLMMVLVEIENSSDVGSRIRMDVPMLGHFL
jgi:hypothetical protein